MRSEPRPTLDQDSTRLCVAVQHNCHIADARHAGDYTLCVYLLKMREYFRWERGYAYEARLPQEEIGQWLREREALWERLESDDFQPLRVDDVDHDPFDAEAINRRLAPRGYVYSAGYGANGKPHFFLGRLESREEVDNHRILVSADECARDLAAPPAMSLGNTIFVRRESLRRYIWEKVQEWRWHEQPNAMARALSHYPFERDLALALEQMTEHEMQAVLFHEKGEVYAERELGPRWKAMLAQLSQTRAELMMRAVRDHLADSISTLPELIRLKDEASLHFYMANLSALRKSIYPSFGVAYEEWRGTGRLAPLLRLVQKARGHWSSLARQMLELDASDDGPRRLECMVEAAAL